MMRPLFGFCFLIILIPVDASAFRITQSGSFRAGMSMGFGSSNPEGKSVSVQSFVDGRSLELTDALSVQLRNALSVQDAAASFFGTALNDNAYFSPATLGAAGVFQFSNLEARIQYRLDEENRLSLGHGRISFGMESREGGDQLIYYSNARNVAYTLGWIYNLGFQWLYSGEVLQVEASLFNTTIGNQRTPGLSFRLSGEVDGGEWSITPSLSGYLGRWQGAPEDIGVAAGMEFSMGAVKLMGEFILVFTDPAPDSAENTYWSIYAMPMVDVGFITVGTKVEYAAEKLGAAAIQNTVNFSLMAARQLGSGSQLSVQYYHTGTGSVNTSPLGGRLGSNGNDLRILFSQRW